MFALPLSTIVVDAFFFALVLDPLVGELCLSNHSLRSDISI